ncbi:MAG: cupin domain-containing protein [Methylocystis sp.]
MKREVAIIVTGVAMVFGSMALAETAGAHRVVLPQDIKWGPAPASLPAGAEAAVLYGDPSKEGMFALRVRIPKNYEIPPHTHPQAEVVTIIGGEFRLGMGSKADRAAAAPIGAGGFVSMPPKVAHYAFADEETVIQINALGPWAIDYLDPKDDPRLNIAPTEEHGSAQR